MPWLHPLSCRADPVGIEALRVTMGVTPDSCAPQAPSSWSKPNSPSSQPSTAAVLRPTLTRPSLRITTQRINQLLQRLLDASETARCRAVLRPGDVCARLLSLPGWGRDKPVASDTRASPPYPIARDSVAAHTRRPPHPDMLRPQRSSGVQDCRDRPITWELNSRHPPKPFFFLARTIRQG